MFYLYIYIYIYILFECQQDSICFVRSLFMWKIGEGFLSQATLKTVEMGPCLFQCSIPHQ